MMVTIEENRTRMLILKTFFCNIESVFGSPLGGNGATLRLRTTWDGFLPPERTLEFGHSENYLGRGVRRDALLSAADKPGRFAYRRG
jgi:hypothetical protein